jgi:magnesium-transporting ATPase (P-type)
MVESKTNEIYLTDIKYNGNLLYLFHCFYSIIRYYSSYDNLFFAIISLCQISLYGDYRSAVPLSIFTIIALIQHMIQNKDRIKEQLKINSKEYEIKPGINIKLKDIKLNTELILNRHKDIPADCKISEGKLIVNEYNLTGEKVDTIKQIGDLIYRGTVIIDGNAKTKTIAIGNSCRIFNLDYTIKKNKTGIEKYLDTLCIKNLYILVVLTITSSICIYLQYSLIKILHVILLFNTLIPLSLQFFLNCSSQLLSSRIEKKFNVKINSHGIKTFQYNPKFIVTDKTGTITQNKIELDSIITNNKLNKICENIIASSTIDLHSETKEILKTDQLEELLLKYLYDKKFILLENNITQSGGNFIFKLDEQIFKYERFQYKNLIYEFGVKLSIIGRDEKYYVHIQGMPESIHKYLTDKTSEEFHKTILDIESNHEYDNYYLRIIAHATKEISKSKLNLFLNSNGNMNELLSEFDNWSIYIFKDYIIEGLKNTFESMLTTDITMLTGDKFSSSLHVGKLIGLISKNYEPSSISFSPSSLGPPKLLAETEHIPNDSIENINLNTKSILISGNELEKIINFCKSNNDFKLFKNLINNTNKRIIYRATPNIKQLYVSTLQNIFAEDVMMIGDGANDLSAIMSANIGIGIIGENSTIQSISDIVIDNWNLIPKLIKEFDKMKIISINLSKWVLFKHILTAFTLFGMLITSNFTILRDPFGPYLMAFINSIIFLIGMCYAKYSNTFNSTQNNNIYLMPILSGIINGFILNYINIYASLIIILLILIRTIIFT